MHGTPAKMFPTCSAPSCGSTSIIRAANRPTPFRPTIHSSTCPDARPGNLGLRPAQSVEIRHRSADEQHFRRRQRLGIVGDGPPHRARRQLRLAGDGRPRRPALRSGAGPTPIIPPVKDHPHTEANSVIGGPVYRGSKLPDLNGSFVYGDYITGTIWAIRPDKDGPIRIGRSSIPTSESSPSAKGAKASCMCWTTI